MSISTVQQAPSLPSEKYSRTELPSKRSGSILVVDDEAGIRNFLHRALIKEYGLVEVAESVETAEELRQRCHFDLLIVDQHHAHIFFENNHNQTNLHIYKC